MYHLNQFFWNYTSVSTFTMRATVKKNSTIRAIKSYKTVRVFSKMMKLCFKYIIIGFRLIAKLSRPRFVLSAWAFSFCMQKITQTSWVSYSKCSNYCKLCLGLYSVLMLTFNDLTVSGKPFINENEFYSHVHFRANQTHLGPVVRKPINANLGLKVKQAFNFSCIKVFFSADVL